MSTPELTNQRLSEEDVEPTAPAATNPVINTDIFADKVPLEENDLHETPMGGTVVSVGPLNELPVDQTPMFETPDQEIPMGGTLAAAGPMDEDLVEKIAIQEPQTGVTSEEQTVIHLAPTDATIDYTTPIQKIVYKVPLGDTIPFPIPPVVPDDETLAAIHSQEKLD